MVARVVFTRCLLFIGRLDCTTEIGEKLYAVSSGRPEAAVTEGPVSGLRLEHCLPKARVDDVDVFEGCLFLLVA